MAALTRQKLRTTARWNRKEFVLTSGSVAYKGGAAAIVLGTSKVVPSSLTAEQLIIGTFAENIDATSADKLVNIDFDREIHAEWFTNDTGTAVASTAVGYLCYQLDDATVTSAPTGACAGRVWAVDSTKGVLVERLEPANDRLQAAAAFAYTTNNFNVPSGVASGTVYDVFTTGAASTITLPASAAEGTVVHFVADGTKNAHTVQYRDATGPTVLTAALTAAKRHQVSAIYLNSIWTAYSSVSP